MDQWTQTLPIQTKQWNSENVEVYTAGSENHIWKKAEAWDVLQPSVYVPRDDDMSFIMQQKWDTLLKVWFRNSYS